MSADEISGFCGPSSPHNKANVFTELHALLQASRIFQSSRGKRSKMRSGTDSFSSARESTKVSRTASKRCASRSSVVRELQGSEQGVKPLPLMINALRTLEPGVFLTKDVDAFLASNQRRRTRGNNYSPSFARSDEVIRLRSFCSATEYRDVASSGQQNHDPVTVVIMSCVQSVFLLTAEFSITLIQTVADASPP